MLSCPRCRVGLFFGQTPSVSMHACGRCGGVWLDQSSAKHVREALPEDAIQLARSASTSGQATDTRGEVACPACGKPTRRIKTSAGGIEIDECEQHGTWFDRGELGLIAEALKQKRQAPPQGAPGRPPAPQGKAPPQGPPPGYAGGPPGGAALAAGAAVGLGVAGAAALMASQQQQQQQQSAWGDAAGDVVEVGADVVDAALDLADSGVADVAVEGAGAAASAAGEALSALADSGAAEAVAEGAGSLLEGVFSLFGALFD